MILTHSKHIYAGVCAMQNILEKASTLFYPFYWHKNSIVKAFLACLQFNVPFLCCPQKPQAPCQLATQTFLEAPKTQFLTVEYPGILVPRYLNLCHMWGHTSLLFREWATPTYFTLSESPWTHSPDIFLSVIWFIASKVFNTHMLFQVLFTSGPRVNAFVRIYNPYKENGWNY